MYSEIKLSKDHTPTFYAKNQYRYQLTSSASPSPLVWILEKHQTLLALLNQESRWQLWLSDRLMLDKNTLTRAGISTHKVQYWIAKQNLFQLLKKALNSHNFSYIAVCTKNLTTKELHQLRILANRCGTHLFMVSENYLSKQQSSVTLYH